MVYGESVDGFRNHCYQLVMAQLFHCGSASWSLTMTVDYLTRDCGESQLMKMQELYTSTPKDLDCYNAIA